MKKYHDNFDREAPKKVFNKAEQFSKTFTNFYSTPQSPSKLSQLNDLADYRKQVVKVAVMEGGFQNQLYRTLQMKDQKKRQSIQLKLFQNDQKTKLNQTSLKQQKDKRYQRYNKHLNQVFKRFKEGQKQLNDHKKQKAIELRKELISFYQKQSARKLQAHRKQVKVGSCYAEAVAKIDNQHNENIAFALKSQAELNKQLNRNNGRYKILMQRSKSVSMNNTQKKQIKQNCEQIDQQKEGHFIQTYCKDLDTSIFAFKHKDQDNEKSKKRIHQFFKKRVQKWKQNKKRVDDDKASVPDKCLNILDKTAKSQFRQTATSFRSSAKHWNSRVQKNKSLIKQHDERQKDKIMRIHEDLSFRNTTNSKMNEKMNSFRMQARKTAFEYL